MKQSSSKIYTDILENVTEYKTKIGYSTKYACIINRVSVSTYNKYLRELKAGTYVRCER